MARRRNRRLVALCAASLGLVWGGACAGDDGGDSPGPPEVIEVRPGVGIGPVELGAAYAELEASVGELEQLSPFNRIVLGRYPELGLDVLLASAEQTALSPDAIVLAVGLRAADGATVTGPLVPGASRDAIEAALGVPPEVIGDISYYPAGTSVEFDGDVVDKIGVFAGYELAPVPPPMQMAVSR